VISRHQLTRAADHYAALEAQYAAQRHADDRAAFELCAWARRERERLERKLEAQTEPRQQSGPTLFD
jgi:hypothetical protein